MNRSIPLPSDPSHPSPLQLPADGGRLEMLPFSRDPEIIPIQRERSSSGMLSLRYLQGLASRFFPHQTPHLVCPPGPIPTGPLPPIIVSSLIRSGTHLAIDLLLNNLAGYRKDPLYVDYDAYVYEGFSRQALLRCGSTIIKTHIAQRTFTRPCQRTLLDLGSRGLVIIPVREPARIQSSMARWGYRISEPDLAALHLQHLEFWKDHDPLLVHFNDLLNPAVADPLLATIRRRIGLPTVTEEGIPPLMAGSSRSRNLWRKLRTRVQASKAPIVNTTVGFRL